MKEVTYNSSLLKDSWNSNETVKPNNFNELSGAVKNVIANANDLAHNYLQQGKQYVAGDIVYSKNLNKGCYLVCTQGGATGDSEPQLINKNVGETVNDGSVVWTVQNIRTTALDSYPVGSIYMSVNSTSPADLFGGTWEAMPAGRVLLAQGTSEWGVEYKAGSTGGEHEHQLSIGELPSHNHIAISSDAGQHSHQLNAYANDSAGGGKGYWFDRSGALDTTKEAGSHNHEISISNTGNNNAHNITQPYVAIFMWKRIS
jgi:microcystin-dependent protein